MIESSNFPFRIHHPRSHGDQIWRSLLGLTDRPEGLDPGRYPAFFLRNTKKLYMSIFTIPKKEHSTAIELDQWPSFIIFRKYQQYILCYEGIKVNVFVKLDNRLTFHFPKN